MHVTPYLFVNLRIRKKQSGGDLFQQQSKSSLRRKMFTPKVVKAGYMPSDAFRIVQFPHIEPLSSGRHRKEDRASSFYALSLEYFIFEDRRSYAKVRNIHCSAIRNANIPAIMPL